MRNGQCWLLMGNNLQPWAMMLGSPFKLVLGQSAVGSIQNAAGYLQYYQLQSKMDHPSNAKYSQVLPSIANYIVKWISLVQLLRSAVQVMTFLHCVFSNISSENSSAIALCSTFSLRG